MLDFISAYENYLTKVKQASANTVFSYMRDIRQFSDWLAREEDRNVVEGVCAAAKEEGAQRIVVGLPRNMDGSEGVRAELCREFAARLEENTGLPVKLWDERRTTVEAHNILSQHNYHGKKRKDTVDAVAASLILEGYLAFRGR